MDEKGTDLVVFLNCIDANEANQILADHCRFAIKPIDLTGENFLTTPTDTRAAVFLRVVCWLIRRKARVRAPGQTSKQNTKSFFR